MTESTVLHDIDPRLKLGSVVFLSIALLTAKPLISLVIGGGLFLLVFISGISGRVIRQSIQPLVFFIVLIFLVHALFTEGNALLTIPYIGLSVSSAGLKQAFFVSWNFLCLIVAAVLLTMTTRLSLIIAAVKFFLKPLKYLRVPVDTVAVMIMIALRLMPILLARKEQIETARKARGYNARQGRVNLHIRAFTSFTTRLLLSVFTQADDLARAMEARNYRPGSRTSFVELKLKKKDMIILCFLGIIIIIFIALNFCFG